VSISLCVDVYVTVSVTPLAAEAGSVNVTLSPVAASHALSYVDHPPEVVNEAGIFPLIPILYFTGILRPVNVIVYVPSSLLSTVNSYL